MNFKFLTLIFLMFLLCGFQGLQPLPYKLNGQNLTRPKAEEFRTWEYVGSAMVPDDKNNGKAIFPGIHHVYINPTAIRQRRAKGSFPDGTIIVMENQHVDVREAESGFGYFPNGATDLLVMVKDRRVFAGSGWSYYLFNNQDLTNNKTEASPQEATRCAACHQVAAEEDEVFSQYYPLLNPE